MADLNLGTWGAKLALDNSETNTLVNSADTYSTLAAMIGATGGFAGKKEIALACALFAGFIKLYSSLVKLANKNGNGVIFTAPYWGVLMGAYAVFSVNVTPR